MTSEPIADCNCGENEWVPSRLISGKGETYMVTHVCCLYCEKEYGVGDVKPNN